MTLILNQDDVRRLLPMAECIDLMEEALSTLARGDAVQPLRSMMWLPDRSGLLGVMPGWLGSPRVLGIKVIAVFPGNLGTTHDAHQGAVLLFDLDHGLLQAVVDATEITTIRTAAVSGAATRRLARADANHLAILGSGTQARAHLEAVQLVRDLERVTIWSRTPDRARVLADREATRLGISVEAVSTAEAAVKDADIICTTTGAREPVLRGEWIAPGTHVNAVGACIPTARELDSDAVVRARLYVDRRESTLHEAGDFLIPREEGVLDDDHIVGELGELFIDQAPGRGGDDEITLFKSLGLAIEDLAAAHHVLRAAGDTGAGWTVNVGGTRHGSA